ncbi:MAG TPA: hypothetical protein VK539_30070 [Myxococcaceae bacterium]|nr:hypothetical protein [Myxococcaceae bacterium]
MSLQLVVDGQAAQNVPLPEIHSFITAQRTQLARLSRAPALAGMWEVAESETRVVGMMGDGSADPWSTQHWRGQLQSRESYERQVDREQLVGKLLREGHSTDAELVWLAGGIQAAAFPRSLSIRQVVHFSERLSERLAKARTDDEMLQLALLRRHAEGLARRMIDWANRGQL